MTGRTVFIDLRACDMGSPIVSIVTDEEAASRIGVQKLSTLFRGDAPNFTAGMMRACSMDELYTVYKYTLYSQSIVYLEESEYFKQVNELLEDNVIDEDCDTAFTVRDMLTLTVD